MLKELKIAILVMMLGICFLGFIYSTNTLVLISLVLVSFVCIYQLVTIRKQDKVYETLILEMLAKLGIPLPIAMVEKEIFMQIIDLQNKKLILLDDETEAYHEKCMQEYLKRVHRLSLINKNIVSFEPEVTHFPLKLEILVYRYKQPILVVDLTEEVIYEKEYVYKG